MSADNIIVIKREEDGKFRAYHRSMSAYTEGQYDYDGPCRYCDGVDLGCLCEGTGHYTSPEETPIFEADTIEEAICKYDKWLEDDEFGIVEYGYTFEGLEPNEKTVEAMEEGERGEDIEVDTVEELMEELESGDIKCPKCGSIHVAINYNSLCGSASEGIIIYWAICNEIKCRAQFHLKYVLRNPQIILLSKERYVQVSDRDKEELE